MDLCVLPIPLPAPTSLSTPSLWVFPVHQPWAPISCIQPGLVICFTLDSILVSMLFSQNIPPSPSPTESKSLFCTWLIHVNVWQKPLQYEKKKKVKPGSYIQGQVDSGKSPPLPSSWAFSRGYSLRQPPHRIYLDSHQQFERWAFTPNLTKAVRFCSECLWFPERRWRADDLCRRVCWTCVDL